MNELAKISTSNLATIDIDKLDRMQRIKTAAAILGYLKCPPSIDEFLDDPYYLGKFTDNLYEYWRKKLREIFPDPITTRYPFLVLTGSLGCGKSTLSRIIALYQLCRIDHLRNPRKTLGIMEGKQLVFVFNHRSVDLAQKEFVGPIKEWMEGSPYFQSMNHGSLKDLGIEFKLDRSVGKVPAFIGTDTIFGVLSEVNFVNPEVAKIRIDSIFKRLTSRFERTLNWFGMLILDSSAQGTSSVVDEFMQDNPYDDKTLSIRASRWEVREHMHYYGQHGWFSVYAGRFYCSQ